MVLFVLHEQFCKTNEALIHRFRYLLGRVRGLFNLLEPLCMIHEGRSLTEELLSWQGGQPVDKAVDPDRQREIFETKVFR